MDKRQFLLAAALGVPAIGALASVTKVARAAAGPVVLTVTGMIGRSNRGPRDPVLDQLLHKHSVEFERAFGFDLPTLSRLAQVSIRPTLEYDAKPHSLRGPLLVDVLKAAGVAASAQATATLRGIDGYAPALTLAELAALEFIVATHIDGKSLAIGGLGPLWAICDADRIAKLKRRPLTERFAKCPWGLYQIGVQSA